MKGLSFSLPILSGIGLVTTNFLNNSSTYIEEDTTGVCKFKDLSGKGH